MTEITSLKELEKKIYKRREEARDEARIEMAMGLQFALDALAQFRKSLRKKSCKCKLYPQKYGKVSCNMCESQKKVLCRICKKEMRQNERLQVFWECDNCESRQYIC